MLEFAFTSHSDVLSGPHDLYQLLTEGVPVSSLSETSVFVQSGQLSVLGVMQKLHSQISTTICSRLTL
jgi:hypothetical protein